MYYFFFFPSILIFSQIIFFLNFILKLSLIFLCLFRTLRFSKELNLKNIFEKNVSKKVVKKSRMIKKHISPFVSNSNFLFPPLELLEKPKKKATIDIENKKCSNK